MEWPDALEEANIEDLRRFFDHYLKGENNGWEHTPGVRYAVQDLEGVSFVVRFDTETELVGYRKAHLWVEADGSDDMDVFVLLQKLNTDGEVLEQFTVPNHGPVLQTITARGASILKYKGSNGRLRVSLRHLNAALSTDEVPVHTFDRVDKLAAGEVVAIDVDTFPVGLAVHPGEALGLTISGHNVLGGPMPNVPNLTPANHGKHVIHTGGTRASYLRLAVRRYRPTAALRGAGTRTVLPAPARRAGPSGPVLYRPHRGCHSYLGIS